MAIQYNFNCLFKKEIIIIIAVVALGQFCNLDERGAFDSIHRHTSTERLMRKKDE